MEDTEKVGDVHCEHYQRNCRLLAPCCNKVYKCRVCHDDAEMHTLDRKLVQQVVCNKCDKQSDICASCPDCGTEFGTAYFCPVCRLYDNVDKKQFHCEGCGICRVGGRDNYEHCYTCEMCMPKNVYHKCVEKSSRTNCPVCFESIHASRVSTHIPKCGHLIHTPCYQEMLDKGLYSCPTCGKAMCDMSRFWSHLDSEIEATPMPEEYSVLYREILCKDCSSTSTVKFHVVGMKCDSCASFNTSIEGPFVKKNENGEFVELTEGELALVYSTPLPGTPIWQRFLLLPVRIFLTVNRMFKSLVSLLLWPVSLLWPSPLDYDNPATDGDDAVIEMHLRGGEGAEEDEEEEEEDGEEEEEEEEESDEDENDWEDIDSDMSDLSGMEEYTDERES